MMKDSCRGSLLSAVAVVLVLTVQPGVTGELLLVHPTTNPQPVLLRADMYQDPYTLVCEVSTNGSEEIQWMWHRDGVVVGNTSGTQSLINVSTSDPTVAEGNYSCLASTTTSSGNTSEVKGEIGLSLEVLLQTSEPLVSVSIEDQFFEVTCTQMGYIRPMQYIKFYKSDQHLNNTVDSRYTVVHGLLTVVNSTMILPSTLRVNGTSLNDTGQYRCELDGSGAQPVTISVEVLPGSTSTTALSMSIGVASNQQSTVINLTGSSTDVPIPSSSLNVPIPSSSLNVPIPSSSLNVPIPSSSLNVPIPSSSLNVPIPSSSSKVAIPSSISNVPVPSSTSNVPILISSLKSQASLSDFTITEATIPVVGTTTFQHISSLSVMETPPATSIPTNGTGTEKLNTTLIIIIAASGGGGLLLLLAMILCIILSICCCCCCCKLKRRKGLTHGPAAAGSTSSLRRQTTLERKGSMFMDDPDYIIKLDRSQSSIKSISRGSIVDSHIPQSLEGITEAVDGEVSDSMGSPLPGRPYAETNFTSPQNSEMESEVGSGPQYVYSLPSPTPNVPDHSSYASIGPSSTPQLHTKTHSVDYISQMTYTPHTAPSEKHLEGRHGLQCDSPLLVQHKANPDPVGMETRSKSPSVYLGKDLNFDKEGFKQYLDVALSVGDHDNPRGKSQSVSGYYRTQPLQTTLRDRHMSSVSNQIAEYTYPHYYEDSHSIGTASTHNPSITSSIMAVQGDPLGSFTPSVVGSSVEDTNIARQSWIDEDPNIDYQGNTPTHTHPTIEPLIHQQHPSNHPPNYQRHPSNDRPNYQQHPSNDRPNYQRHPTNDRPNYQQHPSNDPSNYQRHPSNDRPNYQRYPSNDPSNYQRHPGNNPPNHPRHIRRIRSDNQMRSSQTDPSSTYPRQQGLTHAKSSGSDRFAEILKKKRERRKTYKDVTGFPSLDEFFEHVWTSRDNLAEDTGTVVMTTSAAESRQRASTLQ